MPDNHERAGILDYDCTREGMRKIVRVLFHDQKWAEDGAYVERRFQ